MGGRYRLGSDSTSSSANAGNGTLVPLQGFISSCTGGVPYLFKGNVVFKFQAKQGLDLSPYSDNPWEGELLLNHNTMVIVHQVTQKGKVWEVVVEQILPKAKK